MLPPNSFSDSCFSVRGVVEDTAVAAFMPAA